MTKDEALDGLFLSETALETDWLKSEEDVAWLHLQSEDPSSQNETLI
jgi:hypothetical protein